MKYKEWLMQWLYLTKPAIKECTYRRYATYAQAQIIPLLGELELEEISVRHIRSSVAALSQRYSAGTINCIVSLIKRSILSAEELEVRKSRLNCKVRLRLRYKRDVKCLTPAEQKKLEKYISTSQNPKLFGITVCLYTGLRVGELLALKWSDIDFKKSILRVNKTCHDSYSGGVYNKLLTSPKTYSSKREIPLPRSIAVQLNKMRKESQSEFVISGKNGKEISKRSYQSTFALILKKLGLPHMGMHALRHTFATRALDCGMDVKTLSEILGHQNAAITLNCYVHSLPEHKRAMMNKVGKMLQ